jgi:hypothetical protein
MRGEHARILEFLCINYRSREIECRSMGLRHFWNPLYHPDARGTAVEARAAGGTGYHLLNGDAYEALWRSND